MKNPNLVSRVQRLMRSRLVLLGFLIATVSIAASEPHPLAVEALENLDSFRDEDWSFTKTTTSKDEVRVERHEARKPESERWTLVTMNGRKPTPRELETYRKEKADDLKRRKEKKDGNHQEIDRSTIRLVSETTERATFTFHPQGDGNQSGALSDILGTLVVNKDGAWVERFELANTDEIRPIPGVKISEFNLTMIFRRDLPSGEIVLRSIESHVRGRAFLVKSLDDDRATYYSEFERRR